MVLTDPHGAALDAYFNALKAVFQAGVRITTHSHTAEPMAELHQKVDQLRGEESVQYTVAAVVGRVNDVTTRVKQYATEVMRQQPTGLDPGKVTTALKELEKATERINTLYQGTQSTALAALDAAYGDEN